MPFCGSNINCELMELLAKLIIYKHLRLSNICPNRQNFDAEEEERTTAVTFCLLYIYDVYRQISESLEV